MRCWRISNFSGHNRCGEYCTIELLATIGAFRFSSITMRTRRAQGDPWRSYRMIFVVLLHRSSTAEDADSDLKPLSCSSRAGRILATYCS